MIDRFAMGVNGERTLVVNVRDGGVSDFTSWDGVIGVGVCAGTAPAGMPRSVPVINVPRPQAHVPGCGVAAPSTLVMILDDPSIILLNSRTDAAIDGVERVAGGFLPEYTGYRFDRPAPDPNDRGSIEAAAFELRRVIGSIRAAGVQVRRFMACGALAKAPAVLQVYADVLDGRIKLPASDEPAALGAAILAALSAGPEHTGHASMSLLVHAMAKQRKDLVYRPDLRARRAYDRMFRERYRSL